MGNLVSMLVDVYLYMWRCMCVCVDMYMCIYMIVSRKFIRAHIALLCTLWLCTALWGYRYCRTALYKLDLLLLLNIRTASFWLSNTIEEQPFPFIFSLFCLSVWLSASQSVSLSISVSLCVSISVCLCFSMSLCVSVSVCLSVSSFFFFVSSSFLIFLSFIVFASFGVFYVFL